MEPVEIIERELDRIANALEELSRPCVLFRPILSVDGDRYCVLLGLNLQEGVVGFGSSAAMAMRAFDDAWHQSVKEA